MFMFTAFQIFVRKESQESWFSASTRIVENPITFFILTPLVIITGLPWLASIRTLRILPLKGTTLTLLACGFFILPATLVLTITGLVEITLGAHLILLHRLNLIFLMTAPILVAPGLLLRFGLNWKSYLLVTMPIFASAPLSAILSSHTPAQVSALIWGLGWAAGYYLINQSIQTRSETYRQSLNWLMRPGR